MAVMFSKVTREFREFLQALRHTYLFENSLKDSTDISFKIPRRNFQKFFSLLKVKPSLGLRVAPRTTSGISQEILSTSYIKCQQQFPDKLKIFCEDWPEHFCKTSFRGSSEDCVKKLITDYLKEFFLPPIILPKNPRESAPKIFPRNPFVKTFCEDSSKDAF